MKFLFASISLLSTLTIFTHAAGQGIAVYYQDGIGELVDLTSCIAFEKGTSTVTSLEFGVYVVCSTFDSTDCSGRAVEQTVFFPRERVIESEDIGPPYPRGAIRCQEDIKSN